MRVFEKHSIFQNLKNLILDEIPYHVRLDERQLQRSDQPLLPVNVIRAAIVNGVMHRALSYRAFVSLHVLVL